MRSRYLSTGEKLAVNFLWCLDCFDFLDICSSLTPLTLRRSSKGTQLHRSFVQFFFQGSQALVAVAQGGNISIPLHFLPLLLIQHSDAHHVAYRLLVIFASAPVNEFLYHTLIQSTRFSGILFLGNFCYLN